MFINNNLINHNKKAWYVLLCPQYMLRQSERQWSPTGHAKSEADVHKEENKCTAYFCNADDIVILDDMIALMCFLYK